MATKRKGPSRRARLGDMGTWLPDYSAEPSFVDLMIAGAKKPNASKRARRKPPARSQICLTGLGGWIPNEPPTQDVYFGVDRTVKPTNPNIANLSPDPKDWIWPITYDTMKKPKDAINPAHYQANGMQAIDVIEAFGLGFHLGNVVKYVLRAGKKGEAVECLSKARWYLDREIERVKKRT